MLVNNTAIPDRLVLFDGVCNLCDRCVQFVIRHDPAGRFKFAALQSDYARTLMKQYPKTSLNCHKGQDNLRSIVFISEGKIYTRSTAILKIMGELGFPWKTAAVCYILPKSVRDALYNFIAKNRYRWYGRQNSCMMPTPALNNRFMDGSATE